MSEEQIPPVEEKDTVEVEDLELTDEASQDVVGGMATIGNMR